MTTFQTLADVVGELTRAAALEDSSIWVSGDILVRAAADLQAVAKERGEKFSLQGMFKALESEIGHGRRTFYNRFKVSTIFADEDTRVTNGSLSWTHHLYAAQAADVLKPETYGLAKEWLDRAINDGLTADKLKDTMAGTHEDVKKVDPVYLLKRVDAMIASANEWTDKVVLIVPKQTLQTWAMLQWHKQNNTPVIVTIMIPATSDIETADAILAQNGEAS